MELLSAVAALPAFKVDAGSVGTGSSSTADDFTSSRASSADVDADTVDQAPPRGAAAPCGKGSVHTSTTVQSGAGIPGKRKSFADPHRAGGVESESKRAAGGSFAVPSSEVLEAAKQLVAAAGLKTDAHSPSSAGNFAAGRADGAGAVAARANRGVQAQQVGVKPEPESEPAGVRAGNNFDDGGRFEAFLRAADAVLRPQADQKGEGGGRNEWNEDLIPLTHRDISEITGLTGDLDEDKVSNLRKVLSLPPRSKMEAFLEAVRTRERHGPAPRIELTGEIPGATLVFPGVHDLIKSGGWIIKNQIQDPKTSYAAWMAIRVSAPPPGSPPPASSPCAQPATSARWP